MNTAEPKPAAYIPPVGLFFLWLVPAFASIALGAIIGKALFGQPPQWVRLSQGGLWGMTMGGAFARRMQPGAAAARYFLVMAGVNTGLFLLAWALARRLG